MDGVMSHENHPAIVLIIVFSVIVTGYGSVNRLFHPGSE